MLDDTFEGLEDDDLEEEADKEVEKILFEVTHGKLHSKNVLGSTFYSVTYQYNVHVHAREGKLLHTISFSLLLQVNSGSWDQSTHRYQMNKNKG